MRAGSSSSLVIPGKRFYGNLSHCVLMEKLHARDSSVNIFILKKFYRTEERKSHCCSLIHVFPSRNIPVISFKAFRKRSECHHSKHVPSGRRTSRSHICPGGTGDARSHPCSLACVNCSGLCSAFSACSLSRQPKSALGFKMPF